MISIYTRTSDRFSKEYAKYCLRKLSGKYSGPDAVLDSLTRGLTALGIPFEVNPARPAYGIVHVLSGVRALSDMITLKRNGKISKLIVGPTLVVRPEDHDSIISSPEIDVILQPAEWVRSYYLSKRPQLADKIKVWAAGSLIPDTESTRTGPWIIYFKNYGEQELDQIKDILSEKNLDHVILHYGSFKRREFYDLLKDASGMIYLSQSESQGIALQEAWLRNVPTLVLRSSGFAYQNDTWSDPKINAPYLTDRLGAFFEVSQLADMIDSIRAVNPRPEAERLFSDRASAAAYIQAIDETPN
jgi:hypothetical protein